MRRPSCGRLSVAGLAIYPGRILAGSSRLVVVESRPWSTWFYTFVGGILLAQERPRRAAARSRGAPDRTVIRLTALVRRPDCDAAGTMKHVDGRVGGVPPQSIASSAWWRPGSHELRPTRWHREFLARYLRSLESSGGRQALRTAARKRARACLAGGAAELAHVLSLRQPRAKYPQLIGRNRQLLVEFLRAVPPRRREPPGGYALNRTFWALACARRASSVARKQCACGIAVSVRWRTSSTRRDP